MIQIILNPTAVITALAVLAIATPVVALVALRLRPERVPRRLAWVVAAAGPFALAYWFFHNLILDQVGFDSVYSAAIIVGVALCAGVAVGFWAGGENRSK